MFGFFMKRIAIDTSAEEVRRISSILEQNNLKCEVRTERTRGSIGSSLDAASYAQGNIAMYKGASQPTFIYSVYVNRKDYDCARKLIGRS